MVESMLNNNLNHRIVIAVNTAQITRSHRHSEVATFSP